MSKPIDFLGAAPKTVLNKPFMHVQDKRPNSTAGGSNVAGWNDRKLSTVLVNEISGASLGADTVTLPAGVYHVDLEVFAYATDQTKTVLTDESNTVLLSGMNSYFRSNYYVAGTTHCKGQLTLSQTTTIKVRTYTATVRATSGLGTASSGDNQEEIYTDFKIWQLDAVSKTPVLVADKLYPLPSNTMVTGNIHGLDYAKTGDHEVTIEAGICMDSTNNPAQTPLMLAAAQTLTIPSVINQVYNLFLCSDGVVRADTDVDGAGLGGYRVRWIGFVRNNAVGNICDFIQKGDIYEFYNASENRISTISTTLVTYDLSTFIPVSRVTQIAYGVHGSYTAGSVDVWSADGSKMLWRAVSPANLASIPADGSLYAWANMLKHEWVPYDPTHQINRDGTSGTCYALLRAIKLKR